MNVELENLIEIDSFSDFLKKEYEAKKMRNSKYSLRSFAQKLDIDQSLLSKVISGKRTLSHATMNSCLLSLGYADEQIDELLSRFLKNKSYFRPIDEDVLNIISEWHHFALLELLKLKDIEHSASYLSQRLNIDENLVEEALQRLERFDFIAFRHGKYDIHRPNNTWSSQAVTSEARRKLQRELLLKSLDAIENVPLEERLHSSFTFAVPKSKLQKIKDLLLTFPRQVGRIADENEEYDEVYQFNLSLFPLTKKER